MRFRRPPTHQYQQPCPKKAPAVSRSLARGSSLTGGMLALAALVVLASSAIAQVQFDELPKRHMPPDSEWTHAVALGDVDGDGDPDLVFGNGDYPSGQRGQRNRLYLNDGSGTFTDAFILRMPLNSAVTHAVALGDVDGDGDPDLVCGNHVGIENRLNLNLLRQLATPFLVIPGREYRLDAYARYGVPRAVDTVFPFVSPATAHIPLPPLGILRLDPTLMIALPVFVIPQPAGMNSVSVVLPNDPNLVGVTLYAQALLMQFPALSRLTNLTADLILR